MKPKMNRKNAVEILIAEDSPTQAEKLRHLLEGRGYAVVTARDGKEALASAQQRKPTLIISDVLMPELDGYDLCKAIKSDEKLNDVPVVLLTSLSDSQDVIRGLECGADNFIRKPYDGDYLLSRIEYLLMNRQFRGNHRMQTAIEIDLGGHKHYITSERQQILDLLISTYEQAVQMNKDLTLREKELAHSNQVLQGLNRIAEGLNRAVIEREVGETALARMMELPGVRAGWIRMLEGDSRFRTIAACGLPPALNMLDAFDGDCMCQRKLLSGELDHVTNILECERLGRVKGNTQGLRFHASVPLLIGSRLLGVMNLAGPDEGAFDEDALKVLSGVGNQVAVALERASLHEHLEKLVEQRTAALTAEIAERRRAEQQFNNLFEYSPDAIVITDQRGIIALVNRQTEAVFGYRRDELLGQPVEILMPGTFRPAHEALRQSYLRNATPRAMGGDRSSLLGLRRDGTTFPVAISLSPMEVEGGIAVVAAVRDITTLKDQEARLIRLNRIHRVLSGINTTIVRVRERQELFDEACRIAVEHGKFTFAWIGVLDASTQNVVLVAKAGRDDGYLSQINLTTREGTPDNCALVAQALTQEASVVCNDIASDDRMKTWRSEALQRGYRSVVLFPLVVESQPVGIFVLYASEPNVFDEEEMRLLKEMAGDISFAMDHLGKEEKLNYLAYYDAITGLPNRALFWDRLDQRLTAAQGDQKAFSVILLDPERFSAVNETLGRQAGDELLRELGGCLNEMLDERDILAHLADDCFAIATRRADSEADIGRVLEQILAGIQNQVFHVGGKELRVAVRAGVATFPADGNDVESLYRNAEAALRDAKKTGNRYRFYAPKMNAMVAARLTLENKLRKAVENQEFVLHYQPKISLSTGHVSGLEALIRWADPETGLVAPGMFIPLLEETGMILEVGKWAVKQALTDFERWRAAGVDPVSIAVNVSAIQLAQGDFVHSVQAAIVEANGNAANLELEITESLVMENIDQNIPKLNAIRELGATIAIDDFGTGYSSLSYIAKLPISSLKIDRSFVVNMADTPDSMAIVQTIISLAHSLGLKVVAEGVETEEQEKLLRLLRCEEVQGYRFSRPVPADEIQDLLRKKVIGPMKR